MIMPFDEEYWNPLPINFIINGREFIEIPSSDCFTTVISKKYKIVDDLEEKIYVVKIVDTGYEMVQYVEPETKVYNKLVPIIQTQAPLPPPPPTLMLVIPTTFIKAKKYQIIEETVTETLEECVPLQRLPLQRLPLQRHTYSTCVKCGFYFSTINPNDSTCYNCDRIDYYENFSYIPVYEKIKHFNMCMQSRYLHTGWTSVDFFRNNLLKNRKIFE